MNKRFNKKVFKETVKKNLRNLYRRTLEEATQQQLFQAVSYAVKDAIIDNWMASQKQFEKDDPKIVYYMSMEFLMGRALGNNLINLTAYQQVREALEELGRRGYQDRFLRVGFPGTGSAVRDAGGTGREIPADAEFPRLHEALRYQPRMAARIVI